MQTNLMMQEITKMRTLMTAEKEPDLLRATPQTVQLTGKRSSKLLKLSITNKQRLSISRRQRLLHFRPNLKRLYSRWRKKKLNYMLSRKMVRKLLTKTKSRLIRLISSSLFSRNKRTPSRSRKSRSHCLRKS